MKLWFFFLFASILCLKTSLILALDCQVNLIEGYGQIKRGPKVFFLPISGKSVTLKPEDMLHTNVQGKVHFSCNRFQGELAHSGFMMLKKTSMGTSLGLSQGEVRLQIKKALWIQTLEAVVHANKARIRIKTLDHQTILEVLQGEASIANLAFPGQILWVKARQQSRVHGLGQPSKPIFQNHIPVLKP